MGKNPKKIDKIINCMTVVSDLFKIFPNSVQHQRLNSTICEIIYNYWNCINKKTLLFSSKVCTSFQTIMDPYRIFQSRKVLFYSLNEKNKKSFLNSNKKIKNDLEES